MTWNISLPMASLKWLGKCYNCNILMSCYRIFGAQGCSSLMTWMEWDPTWYVSRKATGNGIIIVQYNVLKIESDIDSAKLSGHGWTDRSGPGLRTLVQQHIRRIHLVYAVKKKIIIKLLQSIFNALVFPKINMQNFPSFF